MNWTLEIEDSTLEDTNSDNDTTPKCELFDKNIFIILVEATRQHRVNTIQKHLQSLSLDAKLSFFEVKGKMHNLPVLFETLIETSKEKDNVVHCTNRGHMASYQPSKSTTNTKCWKILNLFLNHGLTHNMSYLSSFKFLKTKWEEHNWDLVVEELWCLLISNCIRNSNVIQNNTKFGPDIINIINQFLGWKFPRFNFLQTEYGWLFPLDK